MRCLIKRRKAQVAVDRATPENWHVLRVYSTAWHWQRGNWDFRNFVLLFGLCSEMFAEDGKEKHIAFRW